MNEDLVFALPPRAAIDNRCYLQNYHELEHEFILSNIHTSKEAFRCVQANQRSLCLSIARRRPHRR